MKDYKSLIDTDCVPNHVAIIMDGNGRWAEKKSFSRTEGHRRGVNVVEPIIDAALALRIKVISLYAFSTENWSRPKEEINFLWNLIEMYFEANIERITEKGVKLRHSGSFENLPRSTKKVIDESIRKTSKNKKMILNFCLNYGGRQEIVEAANSCVKELKEKKDITISRLNRYLYTAGLPDVDLLIRTSGEFRISNFMLWQIAYSELVFLKTLWPDFKPGHFYKAIYEYQQRERRFGGV